MASTLTDDLIRAEFERFLAQSSDAAGEDWRSRYSQMVERVRTASPQEWVTRDFQRRLWEFDAIGIGPGSSVSVTAAYDDAELASYLLQLRDKGLPEDPLAAAIELQAAYDEILARVRPKYTQKRPRARIMRLLVGLFPRQTTCLMDWRRIYQVSSLVGAAKASTEFAGQNAMIRARLREVLNDAGRSEVDQAMFCWFLWEAHFPKPEVGAVETVGTGREPSDVPEFSMLPATSQRRSLFAVKNNLGLLVSIVRECEQGVSKEDLVSFILHESPQLAEISAVQVINQALGGGLGLIRFADGAYFPTDRGLELLNAPEPGHVLRAPLLGRVFGVGHLLLHLSRHPGETQQVAAKHLQDLVPSWTSSMPGSYIVLWSKLAGFVKADTVGGKARLTLTDDGEDYAAALPQDFEERWTLAHEAEDDEEPESVTDVASPELGEAASTKTYGAADIIAEGCFLSLAEVEAMLDLLKHKKNLVLQGPPGTGKTWLARRLGFALAGAKDPDRVMAVQFQPSLSYEDFVRGWRPYAGKDGQGGLRLADGAFLECVNAALLTPEEPFVLVIEEINRGNPAQILGELLTLLEADKRVEGEALRLAYPKTPSERVFIPPNLYVIGTMNLADRSLALVDLALRRRFAFKTLAPALNGGWRAWCLAAGAPDELVATIQTRLGELNAAIAADNRLRAQFCVGHSFVTPPKSGVDDWRGWFRAVVETEIAPLLDEYWYDDEPAARAQKAKLLAPL